MNLYEFDRDALSEGWLCGVDEAGRGPLAGPVCAAAVILPPEVRLEGLDDSKKLTEKKRERLYGEIVEKAAAYSIAWASREEIDEINILQAALLAMRRAVEGLGMRPILALVDGDKDPNFGMPTRLVVGGDGASASIAAASILAKVSRDRLLLELDQRYPAYGFAKHKGYGTKLHYAMLDEHGPCPEHRLTFLKKWMAGKERAGGSKP